MMVTVTWIFFVIINAFYGSAMTMFFATTREIPFTGIEEVIQAYPSWNLIIMSGMEGGIASRTNNPDYAKYWERLQEFNYHKAVILTRNDEK